MADSSNSSPPLLHTVKSTNTFLIALGSTFIEILIGMLIIGILFFPFQEYIITFSKPNPRLLVGYLTVSWISWVLYVTARSTMVNNIDSFGQEEVAELDDNVKDLDSIRRVDLGMWANIYLNLSASTYKTLIITIGGSISFLLSDLLFLSFLSATLYAPSDYRLAKWRWWSSPTMLTMSIGLYILLTIFTSSQKVTDTISSSLGSTNSKPPNLTDLMESIDPFRSIIIFAIESRKN